jgi:hypothetical protein
LAVLNAGLETVCNVFLVFLAIPSKMVTSWVACRAENRYMVSCSCR